jgi:hypothetical protein
VSALLFTAGDDVAARRAYIDVGFTLKPGITLLELE